MKNTVPTREDLLAMLTTLATKSVTRQMGTSSTGREYAHIQWEAVESARAMLIAAGVANVPEPGLRINSANHGSLWQAKVALDDHRCSIATCGAPGLGTWCAAEPKTG